MRKMVLYIITCGYTLTELEEIATLKRQLKAELQTQIARRGGGQ